MASSAFRPYRSGVALFPETEQSAVARLGSPDEAVRARAADVVVRAYRAPIIAVLQRRFGLDLADAEDLAHDFLMQALTKEWLQRYDPHRARFRTFLRSCLAAYASTAHEAAGRRKRGGGAVHVPLDDVTATVPADSALDDLFDREWVRSVLAMALDALRAECMAAGRSSTWEVFVAREVDGAGLGTPPSYAELAHRLDLPVTQVTNFLAWARPRFRNHVLDAVRALTGTDEEFRAEARALLGVELT
jgi:DNA-directed RNA polymerase specialized sigma24 family protein